MAIEEYMTVYKTYPEDTLAPQAYFLVGFTFDQALHDKERATKAYNGFITSYPNHQLTMQAQELVAFLAVDETDIEQVKKWEKQNAPKK
jgi:TolA-binding protein